MRSFLEKIGLILGLRYDGPNYLWRVHPRGTPDFPFAPGLRYLEFNFARQRDR